MVEQIDTNDNRIKRVLVKVLVIIVRVAVVLGTFALLFEISGRAEMGCERYLGSPLAGVIMATAFFAVGATVALVLGRATALVGVLLFQVLSLFLSWAFSIDSGIGVQEDFVQWWLCLAGGIMGIRFGHRLRGLRPLTSAKAVVLTILLATALWVVPTQLLAWQVRRIEQTQLPQLVALLSRELWPLEPEEIRLVPHKDFLAYFDCYSETDSVTRIGQIYLEIWPHAGRVRSVYMCLSWADWIRMHEPGPGLVYELSEMKQKALDLGVNPDIVAGPWTRWTVNDRWEPEEQTLTPAPESEQDEYKRFSRRVEILGIPAEVDIEGDGITADVPPIGYKAKSSIIAALGHPRVHQVAPEIGLGAPALMLIILLFMAHVVRLRSPLPQTVAHCLAQALVVPAYLKTRWAPRWLVVIFFLCLAGWLFSILHFHIYYSP